MKKGLRSYEQEEAVCKTEGGGEVFSPLLKFQPMQTVAILEINSKTPIDFDGRTIRSLLVAFEFPPWVCLLFSRLALS